MTIHFIAIGGAAMHNLALSLYDKGYLVTGSDDVIHEPSYTRLNKAGLLPEKLGWFSEKITEKVDAIILGMHAKPDNPELQKAQKLGIKIYSYPEFIYEQSKNKTRVVIAGSHGKTTITAMVLHVMQYCNVSVDFMVGAQLSGFDRMVHLTDKNEFILLEGDEYLSSPIDKRPKFHLYKPHIALVSGVAWDHINVFPTFESYKQQFQTFINTIEPGGMLVYYQGDDTLQALTTINEQPIKLYPYTYLPSSTKNGITYLQTDEGDLPLKIFGKHNMQNLAGAKWICQLMGVHEEDFYNAIVSFNGADKRLQCLYRSNQNVVYKDFAHAPSKVRATVQAVANQDTNKKLVACLELHTYSSLSPHFIKDYKYTLDQADIKMVFFSPAAAALKELEPLTEQQIKQAFADDDLLIFTNSEDFENQLYRLDFQNTSLLLMSSGNYGGLDLDCLINHIKDHD